MEDSTISALGTFFAGIWSLFVSFEIPGTHLTPGILLVGAFFVVWGIRLLRRLFGIGGDGVDV